MWWGWALDIASTDVMLVLGPTFHMSFSSLCLCTLYRGARLRIVERFDVPKRLWLVRDQFMIESPLPTMKAAAARQWTWHIGEFSQL